MKNGEIYGRSMALGETLKAARSAKLIYAMNKNLERMERVIRGLEAGKRPAEAYAEFERQRVKLCVDSSAKDAGGAAKIIKTPAGQEYDIIDRVAFDKALEALRAEHQAAIDAHRVAMEAFNKNMDAENTDLKIYRIKYSVFEKEQSELEAQDRLNGDQVQNIWFMLDDDVVEVSENKGPGDPPKTEPGFKMVE